MAPAACNKGNDRFGAQSGGSRPHTRASRPAPIPATSRYGDRSAQTDPKQPLVTPTGFNADDPEAVTRTSPATWVVRYYRLLSNRREQRQAAFALGERQDDAN